MDLPSLYPTGLRPDVPFLAEAIPFPRLATDRMTVVSSSSRQNPAKEKAIPILIYIYPSNTFVYIHLNIFRTASIVLAFQQKLILVHIFSCKNITIELDVCQWALGQRLFGYPRFQRTENREWNVSYDICLL